MDLRRKQEKLKKYFETTENGNTTYQIMGCSKSNSKREVHNNKCLHQEMRMISKNQILPLKKPGKEELKPTVSRRKEITKIRAK